MNKPLRNWLDKARLHHKDELASLAGTSLGYLYQIASGDRKASADVAGKIERAAEAMNKANGGATGLLPRHLLSESCNSCNYKPVGDK